ncbi:PEP-CTERM motif family protein [Methyloversatilis sp. RAC08]|uniref:PEP-CTERM sorting domain-containing protein n=1 Tax=Methyloversatilis sp. RAC08 TaxID=1842540 RepID=UPI000855737B|nr:PEP-CTERM sorting domain-containing protein [Methyloversatilis sp. RAC08]AOF83575.1 PEP-CTERM motif family protein [Methyloversatilis sp. RAC08]
MRVAKVFKGYMTSAVLWIGLFCSVSGSVSANTVHVDFTDQGSFQADVWQQGALTITGSDKLNFLQLNGIGIVGQIDHAIDPGETVIFSFAGPANYVKLFNGSIGNLSGVKYNTATINAFGVNGTFLGTAAGVEPTPWIVVSELFGDELITSFSVRATEDIYRFSALEYALAAPVPEPGSGWMMIGGLCLLIYAGRSARQN